MRAVSDDKQENIKIFRRVVSGGGPARRISCLSYLKLCVFPAPH